MIRNAIIAALAVSMLLTSAFAVDSATPAATVPATKAKYSTAETDIGTLRVSRSRSWKSTFPA